MGTKFACLALAQVFSPTFARQTLADGTLVTRAAPFEVNTRWKEWLGTIRLEAVTEGNFFAYVTAPSDAPETVNAENIALTQQVNRLFHGLLLQAIPNPGGLILTGPVFDGKPEVRSITEVDRYYRPGNVLPTVVDDNMVRAAHLAADGLNYLYSQGDDYARVRYGFGAWWRAVREGFARDRVHQFVRSLEGFIKPKIGGARSQFVHRGQLIT